MTEDQKLVLTRAMLTIITRILAEATECLGTEVPKIPLDPLKMGFANGLDRAQHIVRDSIVEMLDEKDVNKNL